MARSFFSRVSDYAIGFVLGVASGYSVSAIGQMIADRLGLKDIGEWGTIGIGAVALVLASKFILRALTRVVWPFYLGLAVGIAMATDMINKLGEILGFVKKETEQSTQTTTSTNTSVATGG